MTQKDPEKRLRISEYVNALLGKSDESTPVNPQLAQITSNPTIPLYFETCIYPLYLKLHWNGVTPDDRITILCEVRFFHFFLFIYFYYFKCIFSSFVRVMNLFLNKLPVKKIQMVVNFLIYP